MAKSVNPFAILFYIGLFGTVFSLWTANGYGPIINYFHPNGVYVVYPDLSLADPDTWIFITPIFIMLGLVGLIGWIIKIVKRKI